MTPIFADEMPPVNMIWNWLPTLCAIIAALATVGLWMNGRKTARTELVPSPLVVKEPDNFVHRGEYQKQMGEIRSEFDKLRSERKTDNNLLHEKINRVVADVSGLQRETVLQNQQLMRMDSKLDRLVERANGR
jgi:hypothetical protein